MVGFQEDPRLTLSERKVDLHKMSSKLSLYLEAIQPKKGQCCTKKSCPCSKRISFSENFYLVSPTEHIKHHTSSLPESKACSTTPLFHTPLNLRFLEFIFERLKCQKIKSMHDPGEFIFEYFVAVGSGDAVFSPFRQRTNDSIEKAVKAMIVTNISLFLNLGALDDGLRQFSVSSGSPKSTEISELTCSPSQIGDSSLHELKVELDTYEKQVSELNTPENFLVVCPRTSSTCLFQSTMSSHGAISNGLLQCTWKSGVPCFVFMMNDDRSKVFIANPHKIESSEGNSLDYIYLFHSRLCSKRNPKIYANYAAQLVGRMKVRSSFVFDLNKSKHIETEFVLCDTSEDHLSQMQTVSSSVSISKVLSKKVSEIFKPSHSIKNKSTYNVGEPSFQYEELLREPLHCGLCDFDGTNSKKYLEDEFPPNLELAAIVIKDYQCDSKKEQEKGGWGLKFLENSETGEKGCQESMVVNRIMNVIIPAGLHGGPNSKPGGPSNLTERWRSGGHCECGGWDIGCPLKILHSTLPCIKSLPPEKSPDFSKSLDLSIEESVNGETLLKIVSIDEGLYRIYFSPTLSPLQSFSVGVAMIHSQTPSLYPKL